MIPQILQGQTYIPKDYWQVDSLIVVDSASYNYTIPERHILRKRTLQIFRNGVPLREQTDFRLMKSGNIDFFSSLTAGDSLRIKYRRRPFNFSGKYALYEVESQQVSRQADSLLAVRKARRLRSVKLENPFENMSSSLQTSGSIMRGVRIGTNRDLTLNSGLNLELSGMLTDDVEIVAALTDEATPIQPEGNTQTLQEIDKVFVKFKSPYVQGTVGDFNLRYSGGQYSNLSRKLQGLTLLGTYKKQTLGATIATTRGFFNRVLFIGQEGNQGPYQLTGKNGERDIIVLAGTERVWIDGQKMERGESNDYVIEYGNGQIRFTSRRLITSESRIEIDFEYFPAVQRYNRNVYSAVSELRLAAGSFGIKARFYREGDNPDQVLEGDEKTSDSDRDILKSAGDDPLKAWSAGHTFKGDSAGNYVKIDTLIKGQAYSFFKYAGRNNGNYSVRFSNVGRGKGDYIRDRLGVYRWVGVGLGDYLPVKLLPLPSRHDLASVQMDWRPWQRLALTGEFAFSRLDQNVLSSLDDGDNQGEAVFMSARMEEGPVKIANRALGKLQFDLSGRYVGGRFRSVDRFQQPDYQRYWNVVQSEQNKTEELSLQINSSYRPLEIWRIDVNAGTMDRSGFASSRYLVKNSIDDPGLLTTTSSLEYVGSRLKSDQLKNDWWRYSASAGKRVWKVEPRLLFSGEHRKNSDPAHLSGFRFEDYGLALGLIDWKYLNGALAWTRRFDKVYDIEQRNRLLPQAITDTRKLTLSLQNVAQTSATLNIVRRSKDYTRRFEAIKIDTLKALFADATVQDTVWQDRATNLAELNLTHARWKKALGLSLQYRISTEQIALKEKVYLDVGQGRGNLRLDEDIQEYVPDPDGQYLLYILPSGRFEPVTNLQTALRLTLDPAHYWRKSTSGWISMLRNISSETYFRVDEITKEKDLRSIYLLNLSKFQGAHTIRGGIQLNQDLYLMRRNRKISFRLRYRRSDNRSNQFLDAKENEDRTSDQVSVRADWRIMMKLRSQTELRGKQLWRFSAGNPLRNRDIAGIYVNQNFSFRPVSRWEIGLESEYGNEQNRVSSYPLKLWYGSLKSRLSYSLPGKGRAVGEYLYQTVRPTENRLGLSIPFEMARGRKEGLSQTWQLRVEYTVAKNILFTFFYSGRDEAGFKRTIHSGQAELRAFF